VIEFGPILDAVRWEGLVDLEIFSDAELPGSLWRNEPAELAAEGVNKLRRILSVEPFKQAEP
jgi:sugar phosphate isomerase/epimerase